MKLTNKLNFVIAGLTHNPLIIKILHHSFLWDSAPSVVLDFAKNDGFLNKKRTSFQTSFRIFFICIFYIIPLHHQS